MEGSSQGMMVILPVATREGSQTLSPPTDAVMMHSPGARNLIQAPSTLQSVGVDELSTGGIVKPKVGDFDEA